MATKATTKKAATKPVVKKEAVPKAKAAAKTPAKAAAKPEEKKVAAPPVAERYVYAVGRRKTAIAQVRLYAVTSTSAAEEAVVNSRSIREYFGTEALASLALSPLKACGLADAFHTSVIVRGSGLQSQAGAIRLGVARCLIKHDPLLRATLKALGFLTRDARMVERKKPGLKKARRSPQWAKR